MVSRSGIPCSAKMLFRWLMMAREVVLVSFLTIRNLLNLSNIRRYWFPLNSDRSELRSLHKICHLRSGRCLTVGILLRVELAVVIL